MADILRLQPRTTPVTASVAPGPGRADGARLGGSWNADDSLRYIDSKSKRVVIRVIAVTALLINAVYLTYRLLFTLNPDALVFSVIVFLAEVHGCIAFFFFVFQVWAPRRRVVPAVPLGLKVDVFITTYNEEIDLLRQTVRGAMRMRYPHRTFVLDDGRREEVRAMAQELGCEYLTRPTNEHAKAGNWNNAFMQTDADFIATFDADHVPRANFLERTLGFFRDPRVALVQVPQVYHNMDSVQHRAQWERRKMHAEQDAFFNLVMPGKDHYNAAFFCGTGAVLRREALTPYGGILTQTITEDLHTSIVLHSCGWKSVYLQETLVTGLAPMDLRSFAVQRLRWAEGNLRVMAHINPLTAPGLTVVQRINYAASLFHWTTGVPKLVYYLAPPWMLFSGTFPIAPFSGTVVALYLAFLLSLTIAYKVVSRGTGRLLLDEFYSMLTFFVFITALKRAWLGKRKKSIFAVTPKQGSDAVDFRDVLPHLALLNISLGAMAWSALGLGFGVSDDFFGAGVAAFWTAYNMALMLLAVRLAARPPQKRRACRFRAHVPVASLDGSLLGLTADVSEHGCTLLWPQSLKRGQLLELRFQVGPRTLVRSIDIRAVRKERVGGWHSYGVQFMALDTRSIDEFYDLLHEYVVPDLFGWFRPRTLLAAVMLRVRARLPQLFIRRPLRRPLVLPVLVCAPRETFLAVTSNISETGLGIISSRDLTPGTRVELELRGADAVWSRRATVVRSVRRGDERDFGTWAVGLRYEGVARQFSPEFLAASAA